MIPETSVKGMEWRITIYCGLEVWFINFLRTLPLIFRSQTKFIFLRFRTILPGMTEWPLVRPVSRFGSRVTKLCFFLFYLQIFAKYTLTKLDHFSKAITVGIATKEAHFPRNIPWREMAHCSLRLFQKCALIKPRSCFFSFEYKIHRKGGWMFQTDLYFFCSPRNLKNNVSACASSRQC